MRSPFNKTITSLVTAPITQNIALIRISGQQTYSIIKNIFKGSLPKYPQKSPKIIFGKIFDYENKEVIDQVLLFCFYRPKSFTGEDLIEISCHGNLHLVNEILKLILKSGAELAKPGEFTKQAFFNGKLNLIQASAVNDLIHAPSLSSAKLALQNINNENYKKIEVLEEKFLQIICTMEANIDFPDQDQAKKLTSKEILTTIKEIKIELEKISLIGQEAKKYQEGIKIAIVGKPNVGKSTLLNTLLNEERAIVSSIAGTTRDIIEGKYSLRGIPMILYDTAGIHESYQGEVEEKGIKKSREILEKVDLIFFLLDNSRDWQKEDQDIYELIKQKKHLIIINKADLDSGLILPKKIELNKNVLLISAKKKNLIKLEKKFFELFASNIIKDLSLYPLLSHSWQQNKLKQIISKLSEIEKALHKEIPIDAIIIDLQKSFRLLKEISGKEYGENLLDLIFSRFCLGK